MTTRILSTFFLLFFFQQDLPQNGLLAQYEPGLGMPPSVQMVPHNYRQTQGRPYPMSPKRNNQYQYNPIQNRPNMPNQIENPKGPPQGYQQQRTAPELANYGEEEENYDYLENYDDDVENIKGSENPEEEEKEKEEEEEEEEESPVFSLFRIQKAGECLKTLKANLKNDGQSFASKCVSICLNDFEDYFLPNFKSYNWPVVTKALRELGVGHAGRVTKCAAKVPSSNKKRPDKLCDQTVRLTECLTYL